MWKFKSWKGKDKWLFLLTLGVIVCILALPMGNGSSRMPVTAEPVENTMEDPADSAAVSAKPVMDYEQQLEQRVKDILKYVDGVGEVDVMIVLKSSAEKVIHVDDSVSKSITDETDSSGGARRIESEDQERNAVLSGSGGDNGPIIEKELYPELSGIVISASGGGSPVVQEEISSAMQSLFGLPAHKIKVLKRVE